MRLPPKALNVLVDLKKELLDHTEQLVPRLYGPEPPQPEPMRAEPERHTPERTMHHATHRASGYQRYRRSELASMGR